VAGLSLGITSALILFLFIRHELSYDTFHSNKDRIYRVCYSVTREGETDKDGSTTLALKQTLEEKFPQIEKTAVTFFEYDAVIIVDPGESQDGFKKFRQQFGTAYVTPTFYEMFDYKWIIGDYKEVLSKPNSAAISKSIAEKFFGIKDGNYRRALGHILKLNNEILLTINGIIEDAPGNTDLPFQIVISQITHYNNNKRAYEEWGSNYSAANHYVLLKKGMKQKDFDAQLASLAAEKNSEDKSEAKISFFSQSLKELHFDGELNNYSFRTISKQTLLALGLIGIFLIITASVNFINLSTAQAARRSKEVGIKKTLGAGRSSLFYYFMGEIAVIVFLSAAFSVMLAEILTPFLSEKLELGIEYNSLKDLTAFGFLAVLSIITILIAGSYPSFLMSKASPIKAIRGGLSGGSNKSGLLLRRSLVVFQFALSQALIISALVITLQTEFFRTKDLGFNKDLVILVGIPSKEFKQKDYLYNSLKNLPCVQEASFSFNPPSNLGMSWTTIALPEGDATKEIQVEVKPIDDKFIDMYGLKLIAGRNVNATDSLDHIIVNEAFLRKFGITDPQDAIGRRFLVQINSVTAEITGVLQDFYLASLQQEIYPMVMMNLRPPLNAFGLSANIKLKKSSSTADIQSALKEIQKIWESSFPAEIFESRFLDEALHRYYADEEKMANIIRFFTLIAVLIGCIGLYGLISFIAAQKTKEIGVRKVLGASVTGITALLTKEFMALMGISFLISWPLAYYLMSKWLEDYPEKITIGFGIFALAALIAFAVSMSTIAYRAVKAASANPVDSLKYE
jgi:ABC-type antimicrobial peptide transport system permease subunit